MTLSPPARGHNGARLMSGFKPRKVGVGSLSRRPEEASFLSILGWGIALYWGTGELSIARLVNALSGAEA